MESQDGLCRDLRLQIFERELHFVFPHECIGGTISVERSGYIGKSLDESAIVTSEAQEAVTLRGSPGGIIMVDRKDLTSFHMESFRSGYMTQEINLLV